MFDSVFHEISALLLVAAAGGLLGIWLRQPLIVVFIAVGILFGPAAFGWVTAKDQIGLLAGLGISLLLFVVGLKLDVKIIRTMGRVALATGMGQVVFTSLFGFLICLALGLGVTASIYIAVALTFSSTIIIVKLLSDKREIDSLHGRIAIGFLIVQDIVAVAALIGLTAFGAGTRTGELGSELLAVAAKGAGFLLTIYLLMRYVLPQLLRHLARSQELLVLFAIAWAASLASMGDVLGFSKEIGAFLAGVSLASTPYREAISTRLVSLRDFLLIFFFIELGTHLDLSLIGEQIGPSLLLSLFVLVGNPLIVMAIMGYMGYTKRTGFLAGLTVAQISEFSLILGALGLSIGHISASDLGLITLVGLITISASTYMIIYSHRLYEWLSPWLGIFERRSPAQSQTSQATAHDCTADIIIFGLGRFGAELASNLHAHGYQVVGVDFDPAAVRSWNEHGLTALYGDAEDPEFPSALPLAHTRWVISTVVHKDVNHALVQALRHHGYTGKIALTAHLKHEVDLYQLAGADHVLLPFADAAAQATTMLIQAGGMQPPRNCPT